MMTEASPFVGPSDVVSELRRLESGMVPNNIYAMDFLIALGLAVVTEWDESCHTCRYAKGFEITALGRNVVKEIEPCQ